MTPPPELLDPPVALYSPEGTDEFLERILLAPTSEARHVLEDRQDLEEWVSLYRQVSHLAAQGCAALALWSIPVLPSSGAATLLGCSPGGHPARVSSCLAALGDGGATAVARPDAVGWRGDYCRRSRRALVQTAQEAPGHALMVVLNNAVLRPDEGDAIDPDQPDYRWRVNVFGVGLSHSIESAAQIRAFGVGARMIPGAPAWALAEARGVVTEVFRRHAEGALAPVPSITPDDLMMLTQWGDASGRRLAVLLAERVEVGAG